MRIGFAMILLLSACSDDAQAPPPIVVPGPPVAESDTPASTDAYIVTEYVAKGVPAPDRDWSPADYRTAAEALSRIVEADRAKLPRIDDVRTSALFNRMVSTDNLSLLGNEGIELKERMELVAGYLKGAQSLFMLYISSIDDPAEFDVELVEWMGFVLRVSVVMQVLARRYMDSLPADDPHRSTRLEAQERMRKGHAMVINGAIESLTETQTYRDSSRVRMLEFLAETFPILIEGLLPQSRAEVPVRVRALIENEKSPGVKRALEALLHRLPTKR